MVTDVVGFLAFLISAFYCAVGGVILAVNTGQADPELAYWTHSGELVFMTVLGVALYVGKERKKQRGDDWHDR